MVARSTSAVQGRLQRLRREKVTEADISIISPAGIGITCVVEVALHLGSSKVIDSFKALISGCDEVTQCYYVTGTFDFIVILNANDMKHYEDCSKKALHG